LVNPKEIKIQPLYKRWLCIHEFTGGARVIYDRKNRKKHTRICLKCGKRQYID